MRSVLTLRTVSLWNRLPCMLLHALCRLNIVLSLHRGGGTRDARTDLPGIGGNLLARRHKGSSAGHRCRTRRFSFYAMRMAVLDRPAGGTRTEQRVRRLEKMSGPVRSARGRSRMGEPSGPWETGRQNLNEGDCHYGPSSCRARHNQTCSRSSAHHGAEDGQGACDTRRVDPASPNSVTLPPGRLSVGESARLFSTGHPLQPSASRQGYFAQSHGGQLRCSSLPGRWAGQT